jgi:hypothetical protein
MLQPKVVAVLLLVGLATLAACGRTALSADKLLRDGNENDILALDQYQGQEIVVTGRVEEKGMKAVRGVYAERFGLGVEERPVQRTYAFLRLVGEQPARGRVLCLFEPEDRSEVGHTKVGAIVHVAGQLSTFKRYPSGLVATLWQCSIAD